MRRTPQLVAALIFLMGSLAVFSGFGAEGTNPAAPEGVSTNRPAAPKLTFKVDHYEVKGNTVLTTNIIDSVLAPYTGYSVDISMITNAMAMLQLEYFHRGYVTVKVTAPPQQVTNREVLFDVTEGRLTTVRVAHNRFFSSNNIVKALPYVKTLESGERIMNSKIFQTELDRANSNPDRQISPEVRPGLEPGTTALILDCKDRLPLHGRLDFDNYSPPGTPELRVNANISYDNLWQLNHSIGFQYGFSPTSMKPSLGSDTMQSYTDIIDAPNVSYYSGFYRAPLGAPAEVERQIAQNQNRFGYNETTKQFVAPPATGSPELTAYASRSTTGPTMEGPTSTVLASTVETIQSQVIQQQYTAQDTVGAKLTFPLPTFAGIQSSWNIGLEYKDDKVVTLPTNFFYYTTVVTHGGNSHAPPTVTQNQIAIAGVSTTPTLDYVPFSLGWTGSRVDQWLQSDATTNLSSEFDGSVSLVLGTGRTLTKKEAFPTLIANSPDATTAFVAVRPQFSRTQVLPANFTLYCGATGQWANQPLLNLEQFALGGNGTVRGYREGELYSDNGWSVQTELRSPYYWRGSSALKIGTQVTIFNDYGQGYQNDAAQAQVQRQKLWGTGVGLNFKFGGNVEGHVMAGWPLIRTDFSAPDSLRISFSLSAQL
jgi:hemolysin activation/secretion protein